jgi:hypothetical protein
MSNGSNQPASLVTAKSLGTYAGVSGTVMVIWTLMKSLGLTSRWWALGVAALFAIGLQLLAPALPEEVPKGGRVFLWFLIWVGNTAVLASAALGINESASQVVP